MPSWKKLITSGSDAALNDITLSGDAKIAATKKLYLDGGSHTYIHEQADDILEIVVGGEVQLKLTEAGNGVEIPVDSHPLKIGAGSDLQFTHNGTNSFIDNYTGTLNITNNTDDGDIVLKSDDGSGGTTAYLTLDGSAGFTTVQKLMRFGDDVHARFGTGSDLRIFHDGTDSKIDNYTGTLKIINRLDDGDITLQTDDGSGGVTPYITLDGSASTVEIAKDTNVDGTLTSTGDVVAFYSSDERLKDNITNIHKPLAKIDKIGGYKFTWNDKQDTYLGKDVGVLAQEIEAIMPEVVTTRKTGYKAVKYEKIVPLLIEGIKELNKKIEDIEKNCDCLKK